ncbi:MAG TPA: exonuclease SbcCD subunit D C-terminal domain-containing protein, partial [Lentisphaeria bacterium]|nr:exonuclease SbcCD subunit D C-terminal domain-containing protein [Lentisphaeria bacterium]
MKILHTSDWHLGRSLHIKNRHDEHQAFLQWLLTEIDRQQIDVLLVAGDVFDSGLPSIGAQELYYDFLGQVAQSCCRHVVIIAGNHDSPSFLNAPGKLLKALRVQVIGAATADPADEVLVLRRRDHTPELIVAAVPFLRDRDIRTVQAGESSEDKAQSLIQGIGNHYAAAFAAAEQRRTELGPDLPLVAMGHLFTAGGRLIEGDGVRELYVGALPGVEPAIFPASLDYVALGHLHVPQTVNDSSHIRYCGSPLPMGFNEAEQKKMVCLVELQGRKATVETLPVPVFQKLRTIQGDWDAISSRLDELAKSNESVWLNIIYDGNEIIGDLSQRLEAAVAGTRLDIVRSRNCQNAERALRQQSMDEALGDLEVHDAFERLLAMKEVPE